MEDQDERVQKGELKVLAFLNTIFIEQHYRYVSRLDTDRSI